MATRILLGLAVGLGICRLVVAQNPVITGYPIPTTSSLPYYLTPGPDGALWFTEYIGNKVGRITTGGVISEYAVPTATAYPIGITSGPDGAVWFTEYVAGK